MYRIHVALFWMPRDVEEFQQSDKEARVADQEICMESILHWIKNAFH